jgi:hypothetical protein
MARCIVGNTDSRRSLRIAAYACQSLGVLCASACITSHEPHIVSIPQPAVRAASTLDEIGDNRSAAVTIVSILDRQLGIPRFPATLEFYPHTDAFEKALMRVGYDAELARSTAARMTAVGGYRGVMLNDSKFRLLSTPQRVAMLAHELGHSFQYELGGGKRGASDQWLREGFAEWVSIRVVERLNGVSMASVRRDRYRELRAAGRSRTPRLAELVTFPAWVRASERYKDTMYALAFVAGDALLERHGMPAMIDYFTRFATSDDRVANFRAAFGEGLETFEAELNKRLWR